MTHKKATIIAQVPLHSILQRIPGIAYVLFIPFCFIGPIYSPITFGIYYLVLHCFYIINQVKLFWGARSGYYGAVKHSTTNWKEEFCLATGAADTNDYRHDLPFDQVQHVIIIPQYKESLETLFDTLDVLSSHSQAITNYKICLAMEESEKEAIVKAEMLLAKYSSQFFQINYTIHPAGRPDEIRGKSSNVAWAAREMVRQCCGCRSAQIITIMDADTCFAQDYFESLSYHYSIASVQERKLMMFAPTTLFDRNSQDVPFVVRTADMTWSMGVMSNLYNDSPIKFPCSAYSIPMDLATAVGFWDTDAQSMGEDFHMYLKCYFSTFGNIKVHTIYSPASCCNVQGNTWFNGMRDRFTQSLRHMWGCLDFGYTIRRSLFWIIAPDYDAPYNSLRKIPTVGNPDITLMWKKLILMIHRVVEAHIAMGQFLLMVFLTTLVIPFGERPFPFQTFIWGFISSHEVHPFVVWALGIGGYMRQAGVVPFLVALVYYEKYQYWCGVERWRLSNLNAKGVATNLRVSKLGKRSRLVYKRTWLNVFDWTAIPISGLFYLSAPQITSQIMQLFTDRLEYKVASKPQVNDLRSAEEMSLVAITVDEMNLKRFSNADSGIFIAEENESGYSSPDLLRGFSMDDLTMDTGLRI